MNGVSKSLDIARPGTFTPGDIEDAFNPGFIDETLARYWIIHRLHAVGGARCPKCKTAITGTQRDRFCRGAQIICKGCRRKFTALSDSFLSGSHLTFQEIFFIGLLIGAGYSDKEIAKNTTYSAETIRLWRIKFKAIEDLNA